MEFNSRLIFWGLMLFGVLLELSADFLFKKWSMDVVGKNFFFIFGLLLYLAGSFFWVSTLKYEFLSKSATIFLILNLIGVVLIGAVIFKEDLSLINKIGIVFGIISIILISLR